MTKSLINFILPEDWDRYNELVAMAEEAKAKAPKAPRAPRKPMTVEQKTEAAKARLAKAELALKKLLEEQMGNTQN